MKNFTKVAAAVGSLLVVGSLNAATVTPSPTFQVTATVPAICRATASTLAFGTYTQGNGDVDSTSTVSVRCTRNTGFTVGLNAGATGGATVTTRSMLSGAEPLAYSLFRDAGRTQNWGQTIGTDTVAGTGAGIAPANAVALTVYGRIVDSTANQNALAGTYTDTITVTVEY
jgi:spore coat protein U-like protein